MTRFASRLGILLACAGPALPQCAMCRTAAAAQNAAGVLDSAILVLFLPALALFSGTLIMAFRYRSHPPERPPASGEKE